MATLEYHALNISALPHPKGVYRDLFTKVSGRRVRYFGDKIATISKPSSSKDEMFWGYIITWTEIDKTQPKIDTVLLKEPSVDDLAKINIPENIGFNSQIFHYVFREFDHALIFESINSDGRTLAPANVEKIFRKLFDTNALNRMRGFEAKFDTVRVDLMVDRRGLDAVYAIRNLQKIEIMVGVPNSDDNTSDTENLISHLKSVKAKTMLTTYKASNSKQGIRVDDTIRAKSDAALVHGYVKGEGRDGIRKVSVVTKDFPSRTTAVIDAESSAIDTAWQIARAFVSRITKS